MNIHDLEPHLAANRRYWSSWAADVDPDSALPIYRTDIAHVLFNGVLRILNRPLPEAIEEARRRLDGARWAGGSARTATGAPPRACWRTAPNRSATCRSWVST
jgi:hypothetical protein